MFTSIVRQLKTVLETLRSLFQSRKELALEHLALRNQLAIWGAPRIHGELLKLGYKVGQATVSWLMPRKPAFRTDAAATPCLLSERSSSGEQPY